jgi:hypothetical protein
VLALESALFALDHQAAPEQTRQAARQLQAELESVLSLEQIRAAHQLTGAKDLDELVHQYLAGGQH